MFFHRFQEIQDELQGKKLNRIGNRQLKTPQALHCSVGFGNAQSTCPSFFGEGQQVHLQVQFRHGFEKDL